MLCTFFVTTWPTWPRTVGPAHFFAALLSELSLLHVGFDLGHALIHCRTHQPNVLRCKYLLIAGANMAPFVVHIYIFLVFVCHVQKAIFSICWQVCTAGVRLANDFLKPTTCSLSCAGIHCHSWCIKFCHSDGWCCVCRIGTFQSG